MSTQGRVLEVAGLTKSYDGANGSAGVFDLSFNVERGETVGLLGPNGSGKSTALHCITGILDQDSGSIRMSGILHRDAEAKNIFGFLPDDLPMPNSLTVAEVRVLHRKLRPRFDDDFAGELMDLVGLTAHSRKYVANLSHGMKRKLQLVTALSHRPQLLIFDEPMRGLDPEASILLRDVMDSVIAQGGSVLFATHDLLSAEKRCDRVVIIDKGAMIATGRPEELIRAAGAASLEEYFVKATGIEDRVSKIQQAIQQMSFIGESRGSRLTDPKSKEMRSR